ncbi:MAG: SH3 domain-containing protein [Candidatus Dormibacteraeota bacterium]|nr:SH3 domain-containing protein [Candidatus Dormibacteraeota bacterium]
MTAAVAVLLTACGATTQPSDVATNPVVRGGGTASPSATPTPGSSGVRTVLAPLGLNIHASAQLSATVLGTAAQGVTLSVLDHTAQGGGWFKVQGQTVTGWIVADPTLTADGQFTAYQSSTRNFNALYPQTWTFAEQPTAAVFYPMAGVQSIVVRNGALASDFGPVGGTGYVGTGEQTVVVCGVTANLDLYDHVGTPPPAPSAGVAGPLPLLAQLRLRLDATHAMSLDFNYTASADLGVFNDFYNSMTFPYPQCEKPAPSPT